MPHKLLLDQNISYRILDKLARHFSDSNQVRLLGLDKADDITIWQYAKKHGFTIVTKDSDFHELSLINGIPPKIIWLKCGNQRKDYICQLLIKQAPEIKTFIDDHQAVYLEIY
ncbi:MAG: DUF5615 family PIN-like protein [Gammaproteobacteria bacterium]|nr:DUF5615 family PIN-like protein [Gammaproteobacteria bacterium]